MSKSNKIYLGILIVLVIIFLITKMNDKTEKIVRFFTVDSTDVIKIAITDLQGNVVIDRTDGMWKITDPIQYPSDETRVNNMFSKLINAETSNLPLTDSAESLANYDIADSVATLVTFYDKNDKILAETYIGRMKGQMKTPARHKGSNKVYLLNESLTYMIKSDVQNWRDKNVAEIEQDSIDKISVIYGDQGYEISRQDSVWLFEDGKHSQVIPENNSALKMIFSGLKMITSSKFHDNEYDKYEALLANPTLEIGVTQLDDNNVYLRLAKEIDDEKNYVMQKNDDTEHLFVQHESWAKRFMKSFEDFQDK